ncbi:MULTISPECIES: helix-turn-helix transcriptional regulator [Amycolatopsis]|uniref:Helix-turn-helix transcriptional regulator n=1 Tax=Amycolatopsis albidoflavus TaxID=102226 RepID=A0ABW5HTP0_9PSEU
MATQPPRSQLRDLRERRGFSQKSLARALRVSWTTVQRWELGESLPRATHRYGLARILDVPLDALDQFFTSPSPERRTSAGAVHACIPALRRVLAARDFPEDGPVGSFEHLRQRVARLVGQRLQSDYFALAADAPAVLAELHRAIANSPREHRGTCARLLVNAYRAADAIADKYGYYDLSARIIDLMSDAAVDAEDELLVASCAYVRGETFFATLDYATGRRALEAAGAQIRTADSATAAATYGALHMRAAVLAARGGDAVRARDHIAEAQQFACKVNEGVHQGTVFGPASARIHQLSLDAELGDVGAAMRTAGRWRPPTSLPAERRSHFYIELGRVRHLAGRNDNAISALLTASQIAPEHVREHPHVNSIVRTLWETNAGSPSKGLLELRDKVLPLQALVESGGTR